MPTLSITKSYADDTVLTEDQLDDLKDSIETFINTTKLGSDNLQDSAVGTSQLASTSVTTAKIANNAVTDAKLSSSVSTDADRAVGTNHIKDSAVTYAKMSFSANIATGDIAAGAITRAKMESVGQQISSSSGTFFSTSTSLTDVTNLSVSITTTGRPVRLELIGDDSSNSSFVSVSSTSSGFHEAVIAFVNDGSVISRHAVGGSASVSSTTSFKFPPSAFSYLDRPTAGTYTYKVSVSAFVNTQEVNVRQCKLVAYEL
jgi:hypothetical protein